MTATPVPTAATAAGTSGTAATTPVPTAGTSATTAGTADGTHDCTPAERVTRSLLGYGVIAGPLFVGVSLAQALTREGFDLRRHQWSLLANGSYGWVQVTNFVLTGLMVVAAAAGLHRAWTTGPGARWAPRLIAVYGASLVAAGVFRADPALGFPAGTAVGPGEVSWHGLLHFAAGGIGFTCLAVACFAVARRYAAAGRRGFARWSRATGSAFLGGFAMLASSGGAEFANLVFTAVVIAVWAWLSAVASDAYRR
jgi:hypothetical protein